ncbi:MAG: hypothetical protein HQ561_05710 [Desulfobacteraceae bacterium]|nr:hypothetical protein [Desulfobacteraceae bacterium]
MAKIFLDILFHPRYRRSHELWEEIYPFNFLKILVVAQLQQGGVPAGVEIT